MSFLFAPAAGAATFPPSADGESPPLNLSEKHPRPLGRTRLRQFECPGQAVQEKEPPVRGEPACGSSCAPVSGAEEGAAR